MRIAVQTNETRNLTEFPDRNSQKDLQLIPKGRIAEQRDFLSKTMNARSLFFLSCHLLYCRELENPVIAQIDK
jgi:hypothetical protein